MPAEKFEEGYLVCDNCKGYYSLKNGETPSDFYSCSCGDPLKYFTNIEDVKIQIYQENLTNSHIEYEEMAELLNMISIRAQQRKKAIDDLSKKINIQEELLNEIKTGNWSLWNVLEQRELPSELKKEKNILEDISQREERLMYLLKEKRLNKNSAPHQLLRNLNALDPIIYVSIGFILLIILLLIIITS